MVNVAADETPQPKQVSNVIHGPKGWTESFDAHTVDVLVRMGAIRLVSTTSDAQWETNFYDSVGRREEVK